MVQEYNKWGEPIKRLQQKSRAAGTHRLLNVVAKNDHGFTWQQKDDYVISFSYKNKSYTLEEYERITWIVTKPSGERLNMYGFSTFTTWLGKLVGNIGKVGFDYDFQITSLGTNKRRETKI